MTSVIQRIRNLFKSPGASSYPVVPVSVSRSFQQSWICVQVIPGILTDVVREPYDGISELRSAVNDSIG
jgi:hypothetical protein